MKSVSAGPRLPVLLTLVFLTSVSLFMFQVTVTRVFSPILQYHYVFLLTSLAIFGLGVGGIVAYRWCRPRSLEELLAALPGLLLLLAALFILAFSLIYKLPFLRAYWIYAAIASSPFVAGGVVISLIFRAIPQESHGLYFADLLGAGLGGAAVVLVLNRAGVVNAVLILSGLAVLGSALLLLARRQNTAVLPLAVAGVLAALGSYQVGIREFERRFTGYFTSPLTSLRRLRDSNLPHRLVDWSWDSYARTDLIEVSGGSGAFAGWIVSLDGGSNSEMIPLGPELDSVSALRGDLNYLPFVAGGSDRTLLIEIPLVQMLSLFLGHPIRSFITTVATLLLGGGLGSLAGKWPALRRKTRYLPLAAIPVLTVVVYALTARLSSGGLIEPVGLRILAAALLLPLGFFMGMPFPFGMTSLKTAGQEGKVPLVWGLNGIMSIAGSVLAVILSMKIGFSYSLGAGALIYLVLFWLMPQYGSKWRVPG